jgi:hypothetical protein
VSLKNDIEHELGVEARVRAGAPGSLTVHVNGQPVYAKKKKGPPANAPEIVGLIRERAMQG